MMFYLINTEQKFNEKSTFECCIQLGLSWQATILVPSLSQRIPEKEKNEKTRVRQRENKSN